MISVTIQPNSLNRITKMFGAVSKKMGKLSIPLRDSANVLRYESVQNIDTQGFIYGTFAPLAESTRRQRAMLGFPPARPILVRTGKLRSGFKVGRVSNTRAEMVNPVKYAKYHQSGTSRMPKRTIMGVSQKSAAAIKQIFVNYLRS